MSETSPTSSRWSVTRVPTRWRLTLAFSALMALVLAVIGVSVFLRFRAELDRSIDVNLRNETAALLPDLADSKRGVPNSVDSPLVGGHQTFAQVVDAHGRILAATPGVAQTPLLTAPQLAGASHGSLLLTRRPSPPLNEGSRLLTTPITTRSDGRVVLIVGTTLDQRADALSSLAVLLVIVGPIAMLIASVAAYWLVSAALRPVELMRRRAATVSAAEPGIAGSPTSSRDPCRCTSTPSTTGTAIGAT